MPGLRGRSEPAGHSARARVFADEWPVGAGIIGLCLFLFLFVFFLLLFLQRELSFLLTFVLLIYTSFIPRPRWSMPGQHLYMGLS